MRKHQLAFIPILTIVLQASPCWGATKIFLRDATSPMGTVAQAGAGIGCANGLNDYVFRVADTTQGSSAVSKTFAPANATPPCLVQTASGSGHYLRWITPPISTAVTISGNINYSAGCAESAAQLNGGLRFVVSRWSVATGGIDATIHTSADTTECGTSLGLKTIAAAAPTSTAMAVGDRLVLEVQVRAVGTFGGNASRTFTLGYDGAAASTSDTFANFVDTIAFSADTNNARATIFSRRFDPLWILALSGTRWPWDGRQALLGFDADRLDETRTGR